MGKKQAADEGQLKLAFVSSTLAAVSQTGRPAAPILRAFSAASQDKGAEGAKVSAKAGGVPAAKAKAKAKAKTTAKTAVKAKAKVKAKATKAKAKAKAKAQAEAKATATPTLLAVAVAEEEHGLEAVRETTTQPFAKTTAKEAETEAEVTPEKSVAKAAEAAEESEEERDFVQDAEEEDELGEVSSDEDSQKTLELPGRGLGAGSCSSTVF